MEKAYNASDNGCSIEYCVDELDVIFCLVWIILAVMSIVVRKAVKVGGEEQDQVDYFYGQYEEAEKGADFRVGPVSLAAELDWPRPDRDFLAAGRF